MAVLGSYNGTRKQKVLEGVQAALSDAAHTEANAAKTAIMLQGNWLEGVFSEDSALEEAYLNGEVLPMRTVQEKMLQAKYGEAEVALLDKVQERHAAADVAFGDGRDQAQVGLDQLVLRVGADLSLVGEAAAGAAVTLGRA